MTITDQDVFSCFQTTVNRDFFHLFLGDIIGAGEFRIVYHHAHRKDLVVKAEPNAHSFQNIAEWEFWMDNKDDKKVARWLAPCLYISPCGIFMVQNKTTTPELSQYPKVVPEFLTDLKRRNFGMLNKKLVAHDYGLHNVKVPTRLKKAEWWDHVTPRT